MKTLFSLSKEEGNIGWSILWFLLLIFAAKPVAYVCAFLFITLSPLAAFVENEGFQNFIDGCEAQIQLPKIAAEGMKTKVKIQVNKVEVDKDTKLLRFARGQRVKKEAKSE